jgi:hypothetical protein
VNKTATDSAKMWVNPRMRHTQKIVSATPTFHVSVRKASCSRRWIQSDPARARVIGHDQIAGMSKTTTHFAFRVDIWDDIGGSIEHVAGIDFEVAEAAYRAPREQVALRNHARAECQSNQS